MMDRRTFFKVAGGSLLLLKSISCSQLKDECTEGCEALYPYYISPELCTGCAICVPQCGKKAITIPGGERRALIVNQDKCIRCSKCFIMCEYDSIIQQPDDDGTHPYRYLVNLDTCVNCLVCYDLCRSSVAEGGPAVSAIEMFHPDNRARIDQSLCSHCGECVELTFCPNAAIFEGPDEPGGAST